MAALLTTWKRRRKQGRRGALSQVPLPFALSLLLLFIFAQFLAPASPAQAQGDTSPTRPLADERPRSSGSATSGNDSAQATARTTTTATVRQPQDARRRQKVKSSDAQARGRPQLQQQQQSRGQPQQQQQAKQVAAERSGGASSSGNLWRPTKSFRLQKEQEPAGSQVDQPQQANSPSDVFQEQPSGGLQVSITPRVSLVRVPVESNTILKCLISAQSDNFTRPFKIRWSRFMYDENVYEQIESSAGFEDSEAVSPLAGADPSSAQAESGRKRRHNEDDEQFAPGRPAAQSSLANQQADQDSQSAPAMLDRQRQLRDFLARSRQETNAISNILIEATLAISPVKASDNATYYCTATDGGLSDQNQARIDLLALSKPALRLESVWPARDSKSALVYWSIVSDGNTPIKRTILIVRNDSQSLIESRRAQSPARHPSGQQQDEAWQLQQGQPGSKSIVLDNERNQWHRIEIPGDGADQFAAGEAGGSGQRASELAAESGAPEDNVVRADMDITSLAGSSYSAPSASFATTGAGSSSERWRPRLKRKQRAFNLSSLLPGVTYQLKLAAVNDMGQSNWSQLQTTMPNEIPAQISDIVALSTTNDSMTIGWRRPLYDGAKTIRYELQLFDLNRTLTLDANTNTNSSGAMRTNFMFHFVNLNPGTDYHFHIRACSLAGCSAFSSPKLLVSTQDGEPDEPLDVELSCQWVNAGSPPGPSSSAGNEPASVTRLPASSQLSVSWLPPVNVRGKLLNYSVIIESSANYLNQSGEWTTDEWRTTIETGDNHTLSLEASNLLAPNTNYTARVCANNKSKRCGRLSQLTPRAQCSTPTELPSELPANIQLSLRQLKLTDVGQDRQQVETLVLELPFFPLRNGTIDCIQIVLVRLPPSFDNSQRALSDLLPDDPAELEVQEYLALPDVGGAPHSASTPAGNSPLAYLADELDAADQGAVGDELSQGAKQIFLGDGSQKSCRAVWAQLRARANTDKKPSTRQTTKPAGSGAKPVRAIDGPLLAQTYYTGFLKLVQIRQFGSSAATTNQLVMNAAGRRMQRQTGEAANLEVLTKFSNYFGPLKTGEHVPEVPVSALENEAEAERDAKLLSSSAGQAANSSLCAHKFVQLIQERLGTSRPCQLAVDFAETVRRNAVQLYRTSAGYLSDRLRLTANNGAGSGRQPAQMATMQPLEIGLMLIVSTLLVMFVVYLFLLPARLSRKRRLKLKRKLQQHESAVLQAQQEAIGGGPTSDHQLADLTGGFVPVAEMKLRSEGLQQQQQQQQMMVHSKSFQQLEPQAPNLSPQSHHSCANAAHQAKANIHPQQQQLHSPQHARQHPAGGTLRRHNQDCPVHSCPMTQLADPPENSYLIQQDQCEDADELDGRSVQHKDRRQSVHVCQPMQPQQQQVVYGHHQEDQHLDSNHYHAHHHHRHHHQSAYQLNGSGLEAEEAHQHSRQAQVASGFSERNCRTMARRQPMSNEEDFGAATKSVAANYGYKTLHHHHHQHNQAYAMPHHHHHQQQQSLSNVDYAPGAAARPGWNQTLGRAQNATLTLAKKINKSIPLGLFQSVLETRLKNNWLREEYEQLPKSLQLPQQQTASSALDDGRHLKLRPQLIVSRDDSVSALIIGNHQYDASLVKLQVPVIPSGSSGAHTIEKQFICAKSPTDPNTVWDFWRLIYEKEVNTLVMLTPNEDVHTGELRCAQYWPTCDNEVTTILSPRNDSVAQSKWPLAKFKICQETLSGPEVGDATNDEFVIRRLTLLVMATKPSENEHLNELGAIGETGAPAPNDATEPEAADSNGDRNQSPDANKPAEGADEQNGTENGNNGRRKSSSEDQLPPPPEPLPNSDINNNEPNDQDDEVIVERNLLHFQFLHWNASSSNNQMKLIKFIELVNEQHAQLMQQQASPGANWQQISPQNPILVHCANGIGRSGLFTAMSFVIDDLSYKLAALNASLLSRTNNSQPQQVAAKMNLFQLVSRLRNHREMLLSPYRFYELLYQLTAKCIPAHISVQDQHQHHHHHHHQQQQQQQQQLQQQQIKPRLIQ